MDVKIERMQKEDLSSIIIEEFDNFWNMNTLKQDLESEFSFYFIAKSGDEIVGFAGINVILDEAHIANIAVKKGYRNLKIGSKLLQALIDEAILRKASLINLEVNADNQTAMYLYKKNHFIIVGKRRRYYKNQCDAYLMTKYLT